MLSADPERAERHDGLLTSGGRSRGGILALCWVTPTPARRQHAAVSHEQSAQFYVYQQNLASRGLSLWWGFISSRQHDTATSAQLCEIRLPTHCSALLRSSLLCLPLVLLSEKGSEAVFLPLCLNIHLASIPKCD